VPTPNKTSSIATRVGIGTGHRLRRHPRTPDDGSQQRRPNAKRPRPDAVTDTESPVGQCGQHRQLAQEPDRQGDAAQPTHAGAARRSASALRCDRTLRISLSRVLRL
jgi:hypothetical protein